MNVGLAVQWLYWFHAREGWNLFHDARGRFALFPRERPSGHY
jgi:hypothetical protein